MKINQVEELVGITKKNIRFYEDQGLITPKRNLENGYRDYNMEDVERLNQIKLLRRLELSIEEIRKLQMNQVSLDGCLEKHIKSFSKKKGEIDILIKLCQDIIDANASLDTLDSGKYLDDMNRLEKGGVTFMDINKVDVKKVKRGPKIAAGCFIILMLFMLVSSVFMKQTDPEMPMWMAVMMIVLPIAFIVGVILALRERLKEIDGGELNEANKY